MEVKETLSKTLEMTNILENTEYYKYIFKKTEKIVCAIYYVTHSDIDSRINSHVVSDLEMTAKTVLDVALVSLKGTDVSLVRYTTDLMHAYIALESMLRVAQAARCIGGEHLEVFLHEINSVERLLKKYTEQKPHDFILDPVPERTLVRARKTEAVHSPRVTANEESISVERTRSRRERVLEVLRDKSEATIKDIVTVITDCSEKTIQRELISLIKDNIVHREGERRWSKYSIV